MFYDTHFRHNDALQPDALTTISTAMRALQAAIEDCSRAGKTPDRDAAVLLLVVHMASLAERSGQTSAELRIRCALDRRAVIDAPALLAIAGNPIADNMAAKRTFHAEARRALRLLATALGLDLERCRVTSMVDNARCEGTTELVHADLSILVVPRGFLANREISFWRCQEGRVVSQAFDAPIAELLDAAAFARRLKATIGQFRASPLPRAA